MQTVKLGIVGAGNISAAYLRTVDAFRLIEAAAIADLDRDRAKARADEFVIHKVCSLDELLEDPDIEIVVNLTTPESHAAINLAAINAGKHVFSEKPLAATREQGKQIVDAAEARGVRVGCAPSTFLGAALQTCRKLIDEGAIGKPLSCAAFMMSRGHESWHPDPDFYYKSGGGPMFDMGPYYLTALTTLLGPITTVCGSAAVLIPERTIGSQPRQGQIIKVETPDHVSGTFSFAGGQIGTTIMTFAVYFATLPRIEIYGSEGSLSVPDPNSFSGTIKLRRQGDSDWQEQPYAFGFSDGRRYWGMGIADMAHAIRSGRPHRATGAQAYHVLDVMQGFLDSSENGTAYHPTSTFKRPAPLPEGLREDRLDD